MRVMQYAVIAPVTGGRTADPEWISALAQHVEACGFESIVAVEHTVVVRDYTSTYPYAESGKMEPADTCDIPDPLDLLSFLAARTSTLGLATGVLVLPNHHPVVLAKRLATIDALSGGRLRICAGLGWMREEIEACGTDFDTRARRSEEQIQLMRELWAGDAEGVDHSGRFFDVHGALSYPKPAQPRGPGIHIGGHSAAAARRAGRVGDGLQPLGVSGDALRGLVTQMRDEAERCGRDPDELGLSLGHVASRITADKAERLGELGADRIVLATSESADLALVQDELSACAERLGLR